MKAETPIPIGTEHTEAKTCELARRLTWLFANRGITRQPDVRCTTPAAESITRAGRPHSPLRALLPADSTSKPSSALKHQSPLEIFTCQRYGETSQSRQSVLTFPKTKMICRGIFTFQSAWSLARPPYEQFYPGKNDHGMYKHQKYHTIERLTSKYKYYIL